ncbi:HELZ2, partial [Symbiodinium microadriaticum]
MLEKQYRMHDTICSFPSRHFYDNRLQNAQGLSLKPPVPSVWPSKTDRVVWFDCSHPHSMGSVITVGSSRSLNMTVLENNTSLKNEGEAEIIIKVYKKLMESGHCRAEDVAIITPYKAQEQHIQRKLKELPGKLGKSAGMTAVGTVFSMQ